MKRSRQENKELTQTVRVNGRIYAAFRSSTVAEDFAYTLCQGGQYDVVLSAEYGDELLHLKATAPN